MENGHEVLESTATQTYGSAGVPTFAVHHEQITATGNGADYYLPQYRTDATAGPVPQTPLVNGDFYTGGPMHLISSDSSSSASLNVWQRSALGSTYSLVAALSANQYAEVFWMGNTIGAKVR